MAWQTIWQLPRPLPVSPPPPLLLRAKQEGNKEKKVQLENKKLKLDFMGTMFGRRWRTIRLATAPGAFPQGKKALELVLDGWNIHSFGVGNKCIVLNWSLATTILVVRSLTDFMYFLHILLQFRLAYVAPESRVVGAGDLVDDPKKVALNYLQGYFILDLFVLLPLPQIHFIYYETEADINRGEGALAIE
ncbi:hypothetical protein HPP92_024540 [Vanilla planifolia]|uniref:Uncharacterized protein n=1 Tax=Vanilla planifolia TaxID=51239 RepID=A0A835PSF0_VANPL|nr:hypothetical protein HPP92_024540 [Vanilla planifolia]